MFLALAMMSAQAMAAKAEYGEVQVNWEARYLEETVVMMCDDTVLSGIDLAIEGDYTNSYSGKLSPESYISLKECGADWKITAKKLIEVDGKTFTKVRYKGGSSCDMEIREKAVGKKRKFVLTIGDAC